MTRFSEALLADLARSGLNAEDAERLGLEDLDATASKALGFHGRIAYKIPYFDVKGNVTPEFYRVRFLDDGKQRYSQPSGAAPRLYFPLFSDWTPYLVGYEGAKPPIVLTEGEKKAAASSKIGMPTVGLGGVWSWMSHKLLLPDFKLFDWHRDVYLIFDSDVMVKQQVRAALHALARELSTLGAKPFTVILKDGPNGEKTGIDDFLVREGAEAYFNAMKLNREPFTEITEFWKLNEEYAVILSPPSIFKLPTPKKPGEDDRHKHELIRRDDFVKIVEGARRMVWKDSAGKEVIVYAGDKWIQWPGRRVYSYLDYLPGEPQELSDGGFNLWPGLIAEAVEGDISPWLELLDHVFQDEHEARKWFEQWCAYPIKYLGTKLYCACVMWGSVQGCGKSLLGLVLGDLYGENFAEINQGQLHGNFNDWSRHKQFILAEEVCNSDKRADEGKLKAMITRDKIAINAKFKPEYVIADTVNYLFTSNQPDAMFFVKEDRRYFAHRIEKKLSPERGNAIRQWSKSKAGAGALRWHFEHLDTTGFNPRGAAPMTRAKADMIEASWTDLDRWANKLATNPTLALSGGAAGYEHHDLWTTEDLAVACDFDKAPTLKALGNALARAGIKQTERMGQELGGVKLWIVSNAEHWLSKTVAEIAAGYKNKTKASKF